MNRTLKSGDLIVIAYSNRLQLAIYKKMGTRNNPQFYFVGHRWLAHYGNNIVNKRKVYCSYINRLADGSIAKVDPSELNPAEYDFYRDTLKLLKENGYL